MEAWNLNGRFQTGRLVLSSRIGTGLTVRELAGALGRHSSGDWGEVNQPLRQGNDQCAREGWGTLVSMYEDRNRSLFVVETNQSVEETAVYYLDEWTDYVTYRQTSIRS